MADTPGFDGEDDFLVEDILAGLQGHGKTAQRSATAKASVRRGKSRERQACAVLNEHFSGLLTAHVEWGGFSRTAGSGNRTSQGLHLSNEAQRLYAGDIVCPTTFRFTLECKGGYNDVDLMKCFSGRCRELDEFLGQAISDAAKGGREPMLLWNKTRQPWVAFYETGVFDKVLGAGSEASMTAKAPACLRYGAWTAVDLTSMLTLGEVAFFNLGP